MKTYPLTETMLGMFLEWDRARESIQYTVAFAHVFPKSIDAERLVAAVEKAVADNAVFRARFIPGDEAPRWTVDDSFAIKVARLEMSDAEADVRQRTFARPFDPFSEPLARFSLIETPTTFRLLSEIFHPVTDGTSVRNFLDAVAANYENRPAAAGAVDFREYAEAEAASFSSPEYAAAREAAIARFAGRAMSVPDASPRTIEAVPYIGAVTQLPRSAIDAYCRRHELHVNLFFMGVFARTLSLYTNEENVVFWTVNHGRGKNAALKATLGCFVKTVPVLGEMKAGLACVDYFKSFKLHRAGVYPFTHFCRELNVKPGWGVVYQEGTLDLTLVLDGVHGQTLAPMAGGAGEIPAVQVHGGHDGFTLEITCTPGRYDRAFIAGFIERMKIVAANFVSAERLGEVAVTTEAETEELVKLAYGGELDYDASKTFVDLFREQAAARPDAVAVVDCDCQLTYRELDGRSDALAAILIEKGVAPGDFVAVKLPRRVSFAVAMLAVEKCGAGYVPLDPEYPEDRLAYMVADSQSKVVVDEGFMQASRGRSAHDGGVRVGHAHYGDAASPAYMIYTSGSTGRPKGVVIPHRALLNLIHWYASEFGAGPGKRNLHLASFSFDASVPDLFVPLAFGGELHILDEETRKDLAAVGDYCVRHRITGAAASTKMGLALVNSCPALPLECMMVGGEKLTAFAKTPVRMINGYGPTEFTVCSSFHEVDQSRSYDIPIGRAAPNTYSFIVDKLGALVPRGMTGEIALAGVQLADGYWHQPEKTAKAFVNLPSNYQLPTTNCQLAYRTGDLGRYNADGELDFLGRIDFQVKLRGFRIEIGEIEHVASTFPGVGGVIAMVRTIAGADHLVLYYERGQGERSRSTKDANLDCATGRLPPVTSELKAHLAAKLTPYMVPDYFVEMERLPQTPGGKIDRKALPLPEAEDEPVVAPADETESRILECVKAVLKREDFGVTHDFNHLGLTSLGAMELVVKLKKTLGLKVTMRQLAEHPSVRQLAGILKPSPAQSPTANRQPPTPSHAFYPMTENQRGIYVDWLRNPNTTQYNIPGAIRFPNQDPQALAQAVAKVMSVHPAFSIHFAEHDGEVMQELADPQFAKCGSGTIEVVELDQEPDAEFFASQVAPFSPTDACLARIKIYHTSTSASYLFLDIHHTIFDGVSMGVFLKELLRVLDGAEPAGEECSPTDFAVEERKYLEGVESADDERWFERYLEGAESTRIEESASVAATPGKLCGRVRRDLAGTAIAGFCKDHGISPSDYLLTVFTELLKRIGRSEDILVNFVSAGRTDPAIADTVGMFVKTLPVRGVKDAKTFAEASAKMHLDVLDLLDRSRVSYARLSERFGVRPDILFVYEGGIFELPRGASLVEVLSDTPKAPLALVVNPSTDGFSLNFEYDRTLYAAADIERLSAMFATLAEGAARIDDLKAIPLVGEKEAQDLLALAYGGDIEYDETKTFLNLFSAAVRTRSFATAVVDAQGSLTYGELDVQSSELAAELVERGVKPGEFVAIRLGRVKEFVVAAIGVMKAGAAYVPVDPGYPEDRIAYMVEDSQAKVVVDEGFMQASRGRSAHDGGVRVGHAHYGEEPSGGVRVGHAHYGDAAAPAYMIYTSGSTGKPKGVVVPHRALRHMLAWMVRDCEITYASKVLEHASFSFDASVISIFPALAAGGEVHILAEELRKDLPGMRDYILEHGITSAIMSTQIGMALIDAYPDLPLHDVMFGGEKLMATAKTDIKIFNGYGPTEFTVSSSYEVVDQSKAGDIPIGRAVAGTWSVIVDRYGHLLPRGTAGELALIGPQIADGYWHQPEKTAKAFVDLPWIPCRGGIPAAPGMGHLPAANGAAGMPPPREKAYRTGDLARYNAEGKLEYLGRLDFQVKLRGFRIEIGEIESVAKQFPGVGAVAAEVRDVGGAKHLVLYYERGQGERSRPTKDANLDGAACHLPPVTSSLKTFLEQRLTGYMVPDYFVEVERMPMTPNGKIDRRKLATPSAADSPREYVEPATDAERTIAKCYGGILKAERFGATDDFFELGGTSIVAIKAVVALQKAGLDVQYGDVFKYKTPRALAAFLTGTSADTSATCHLPPVTSVFGDYDYTAIDALLAKTRTGLFEGFRVHSLGDVLLTGATGYLGIHILRYLLERTSSSVTVLLRTKGKAGPERRLNAQYVYYFGERIPRRFQDRIAYVAGDITDGDLASKLSGVDANTVVNCAALVKHYIADDALDRVNVKGVENLLAWCGRSGARFIQTSTYSVGGMVGVADPARLDERRLYVGQSGDNDYIRTKFLAERAVLAAVAAGGVKAKIMRLGNLMGREADGEFQMNLGANAFVNSLKSYKAIGAFPLEELASPLEMSPIDRVAEAVCLLATTPDDMVVFHPYNAYALDMGAVLGALNRRGYAIDFVDRGEFAARVDALRNDPRHAEELQGILHYAQRHLGTERPTPVANVWTTTVLYRLGFRWKPADDRYLANFFDMLDGLAVFG